MIRIVIFLGLAAFLLGCGGGSGGGISGTGIVRDSNDLVIGTIDGFGSVIVNQLRLDTDNAEFFVNGSAATQAGLSVGMQVRVNADLNTLSATRIDYTPLVVGPASSVDNTTNTLEILGHVINTNSDTHYSGVIEESIPLGSVLEVSGFINANNEILATYISASEADLYQIQANINAIQQGFNVSIDLSSIDFLLEQLQQQLLVLSELQNLDPFSSRRAVLTTPAQGGTPNLTLAYLLPENNFSIGARAEVTQAVTGEAGPGIFTTDDFIVTVTAGTTILFDGGVTAEISDIKPNHVVRISGTIVQNSETILAENIVIVSEQ